MMYTVVVTPEEPKNTGGADRLKNYFPDEFRSPGGLAQVAVCIYERPRVLIK